MVDSDARLITLQTELIASKDAQLKAVTSTVGRDRGEGVCSEILQPGYCRSEPASSRSAVIQRAVRDFTEGKDRSKNLLVFRLQEEDGEEVRVRVSELFGTLGEKPRPEEVLRLGKKSTDHHRPVIVKLRTAAAADGVIKKSQGLRNSEKTICISPDRTIAQRIEHRKLVSQMKERAAEDKIKRFFIGIKGRVGGSGSGRKWWGEFEWGDK